MTYYLLLYHVGEPVFIATYVHVVSKAKKSDATWRV